MRTGSIIILLLFGFFTTMAQPVFKVIIPAAPVVIGQPFTVQYIMDASGAASFNLPDASAFSFVNGPDEHIAGPGQVNQVYTLVARREGKQALPPASTTIKGKEYLTQEVFIEVLPDKGLTPGSAEAETTEALLPGEDPYKKIKDHIFVQVDVSSRQCVVGQPIVATYKIYSDLSSESDVIKNPAFYGFSVVDIIDKPVMTRETFRGKTYYLHTLRKVQLYPLQSGKFTVDAMEVLHRVRFGTATIQQKITEGVVQHKPEEKGTVYESRMSSQPIVINVLPLPETNRPDSFGMATGKFSITAEVNKTVLAKNETCFLSVALTGKGNIIQIAPPAIDWPEGFENFEPRIQDTINRVQVPLAGTRKFLYSFLSPQPGSYTLPAITFTFFDTDSNRYRTIQSKPLKIVVEDREFVAPQPELQQVGKTEAASRSTWLFISVLLVLGIGIAAMLLRGKKEKKSLATQQATAHIKTVEELLQPAADSLQAEQDNSFYTLLRSGIYGYLAQYLEKPVSSSTKQQLQGLLTAKKVSQAQVTGLFTIIEQCEHGAFTLATLQNDKAQLLQDTTSLLKAL